MPTLVFGDNTGDDHAGTEDTYLAADATTTNYGTNSEFDIYEYDASDKNYGLLSFSSYSNLPSSITVSSATISIYMWYATGTATHTLTYRRCLRNWVETQATHTIYSTGNNWTTGGGLSDGNDRSGTTSDTVSVNTTTDEYKTSADTAQLRTDIENFASGTYANYGHHIERTDGTEDSEIRSFGQSDWDDGKRPYSTVTYTEVTAGGSSNLTLLGVG